MENSTPKKEGVKWIPTPASPFFKQVAWWLKSTGRKYPLTMEGWIRAARLFQEKTAPLN